MTAEPATPEASAPASTDAFLTLSTLGTIRAAVALVWSAGPRQLTIILLTTVVTSLAIAGQLLVGRTLLDRLADNEHTDAGELAGPLLVLGALMLIGAVSQAVAGELRIPLGEPRFGRPHLADSGGALDWQRGSDPAPAARERDRYLRWVAGDAD